MFLKIILGAPGCLISSLRNRGHWFGLVWLKLGKRYVKGRTAKSFGVYLSFPMRPKCHWNPPTPPLLTARAILSLCVRPVSGEQSKGLGYITPSHRCPGILQSDLN